MPADRDRGEQARHRLGFSIRAFGAPDLPSYDGRSPAASGHLSVNLAYLRDIALYLAANGIGLYRMHSGVLPRALHEDPGELARQIGECRAQLDQLAGLIASLGLRLSFHPYSLVLNALDEEQAERSIRSLTAHAALLDALGLGPEAVAVLHVGGVYDDAATARERFARRYEALPEAVRRRVALEQDDRRFGFADVRRIHAACGAPLVFDYLHHRVWNPEGIELHEALAISLESWPAGVRPKVHFCSARSEMRRLEGSQRLKAPSWNEHADYVVPWEFADWLRGAQHLRPFDIMLEAKARDMALLQLRRDLARHAPDLAGRVW
jgi:UV DNA damage endonuclease